MNGNKEGERKKSAGWLGSPLVSAGFACTSLVSFADLGWSLKHASLSLLSW